ncbi:MAG: outer membrane protein transport protein [Patescibacteria group bacterium]
MKKGIIIAVVVAIFLCIDQSASAGGLSRVAATGTTDIGLGSDPSGAWFPHNLGSKLQLSCKRLVEVGAEVMVPKFTYEDGRGKKFTSKNMAHVLPAVSYAERIDESTVWGVDIHTNYGLGASFKNIWYGMDSQTLVSGTYIKPFISKQLTDRLSIGAGPVIAMGMMTWAGPFDINRIALPVRVNLKALGFGYGWQAGAMYQATDKLALGVNYLSPVTVNLEGRCSASFLGLKIRDGIDLKFKFPEKFDFSVGYQPREDWLLVGQVTYFGYSRNSLNRAMVNFDKLPITKAVNMNWQDNIAIHLGASHKFSDKLTAGGGVTYMSKAITKTADYMTPDVDGWALGGRIKYSPTKHFSLIASTSYGWGSNEVSGRKMSTEILTFGLSGSWRF